MRKFKALVLGLTMVCAVGLFTACGEVPEVTEKDVLKALEKEGIITDEMDEEDYSVTIDETDVDDDGEKADVTCTLTTVSGYIKYETEYELKFKIDDDKESWKYRKKIERGETKESLAKGIEEEDIENELSWENIEIDGNYLDFGDEITDYEVTNQETDLEEKKDVITIEGKADYGYTTYDFTVDITFTYDWGWYFSEYEVTEYETSYAEGYAEDVDADKLKEDLIDSGSYIYEQGFYYYYNEADSLEVSVTDMKRNDSYATVTADITLEYHGVKIIATAEVEYYYYDYDKEWDYEYVNDYEVTSWESNIFGTYKGSYTYWDETTNYTLTLINEKNDDGHYKAEVEVSTASQTYSYSAYIGYYEPDDYYISIYGDEWIVEPTETWTYMDSFYGYMKDDSFEQEYGNYTLTKQ